MQVYAAIAAPRDLRPRIAILLTGLGMSAAEDDEASVILPAAVSFGVSPYGYHPEATGQMLRARGHESLMSLPMEPQGFPIDDSGPEALLTGNTDPVNRQRMEWAMSRDAGYVGITSSMGTLRGERFASSDTQMSPLRHEIAVRGLLYIDARPGAVVIPGMAERGVDVILDAAAVRTEIDAKLALLEEIARARGSAIGLAGPPHPVIVARIDAWASTLKARGFVLVPVSALASLNGTIVEGGTSP